MQQDPFLFNDTILRNLELGLVGTAWEHSCTSDKRRLIEQACKEAFAHDFISALPDVSECFDSIPLLTSIGLRYPSRG